METTTEKTKTGKAKAVVNEPVLRKLTTEIVKLEIGDHVDGYYLGTKSAPWIDKTDGEEKELTRVFFERTKGGDKFILFQDAGLKNALANAMVEEGDHIRVQKLEQVELSGGRRCNQYDIFQIQG